ncbi:hypothetical protein [Duncaniella sp.]|uniref:hypothetical protein n=1 Tax=Duncaniella sp. TaxID=2518496 RepID=UPI0023C6AE33|nr:hypothetical protein [Duncaniella sp.]MDE5903725.1 hypothetical protein [Duncaniella sp.]
MKKSSLPVSRKFYSEICDRIRFSFSLNRPSLIEEAISTVDSYITRGAEPAEYTDPSVLLMFSLLRPEIDKAIRRSQRAREISSRRKSEQPAAAPTGKDEAGKLTEDNGDTTPFESEPTEPEEEERPILNRRMRRLIRQERKRAARQRIKPLQRC